MSFLKNIKICLDRQLVDTVDNEVIIFEGQDYKPDLSTGYYRPNLIPGNSNILDFNGTQEEHGIYQVDIVFPANQGLIEILNRADVLFDNFRNQELEHEGTIVYIREVSRLPFFKEGAKIIGAVQINYVSYSQST